VNPPDPNSKSNDPNLIANLPSITGKRRFQIQIIEKLKGKELLLIADPRPRMLLAVVRINQFPDTQYPSQIKCQPPK
jgi:hypothetical protein